MAGQFAREWIGIQQFPAATQNKLHELLGKLKQEVFILHFFLQFTSKLLVERLVFRSTARVVVEKKRTFIKL